MQFIQQGRQSLPNTISETHPRPQMTRERWTDLGGVWQFAYDDANRGMDGDWARDARPFDRGNHRALSAGVGGERYR